MKYLIWIGVFMAVISSVDAQRGGGTSIKYYEPGAAANSMDGITVMDDEGGRGSFIYVSQELLEALPFDHLKEVQAGSREKTVPAIRAVMQAGGASYALAAYRGPEPELAMNFRNADENSLRRRAKTARISNAISGGRETTIIVEHMDSGETHVIHDGVFVRTKE